MFDAWESTVMVPASVSMNGDKELGEGMYKSEANC